MSSKSFSSFLFSKSDSLSLSNTSNSNFTSLSHTSVVTKSNSNSSQSPPPPNSPPFLPNVGNNNSPNESALLARISLLENELRCVCQQRDLLQAVLRITADDLLLKDEQFDSLYTTLALNPIWKSIDPNSINHERRKSENKRIQSIFHSNQKTQTPLPQPVQRQSSAPSAFSPAPPVPPKPRFQSIFSSSSTSHSPPSLSAANYRAATLPTSPTAQLPPSVVWSSSSSSSSLSHSSTSSSPCMSAAVAPVVNGVLCSPLAPSCPSCNSSSLCYCSLSYFRVLPSELFTLLLSYLDDSSLRQFSLVCFFLFFHIRFDDLFWKKKFLKRWKIQKHLAANVWKRNEEEWKEWKKEGITTTTLITAAEEKEKDLAIGRMTTEKNFQLKMKQKTLLMDWMKRKDQKKLDAVSSSSSSSSSSSATDSELDRFRFQRFSSPISSSLLFNSSSMILPPSSFWKEQYEERLRIENNWQKGKPTLMTLREQNGTITALKFDEKRLVSSADDGSCVVWALDGNSQAKKERRKNFLEKKSAGGILHQQHHKNTKVIHKEATLTGHAGPIWCLDFQENLLITGSYDKQLLLWNLHQCEATATLKGHTSWVSCVQLHANTAQQLKSADPIFVCSGSWDCSMKMWKVEVESVEGGSSPRYTKTTCLATLQNENGNVIYSLQWQPQLHRIIAGCRRSCIQLWDTEKQKCTVTLHGHSQQVYAVQADEENDEIILSGSGDGAVKLWDFRVGHAAQITLRSHSNSVMGLSANHLGRVVSCGYDKQVKIWDLRAAQAQADANDSALVRTLEGHSSAVFCVQMDYNKIISGSADKNMIVYDFDRTIL